MIQRGCAWGCLLELVAIALCGVVILAAWALAPSLIDAARRALS